LLTRRDEESAGMSLVKGWKGFSVLGRIRPARIPDGLNSKDEFHVILKRERARSDRNGQGFSVVAFRAGCQDANNAFAECLKSVLLQRVRMTDEIGWLDEQRIGVLLCNTPTEGAWDYASHVQAALAAEGPVPECTVYTYPVLWVGFDDEKGAAGPNDRGRQVLGKRGLRHSPDRDCGTSRKGRGTAARTGGGVMGANVLAPARDTVQSQRSRKPDVDLFPPVVSALPVWKRVMDIVGATVALIVLSPVMFAVAIAIRLTSNGPIIFRQLRAGLKGRPFTCYKFRTMVVDAEARKKRLLRYNERSGVAFKMTNDPRVTLLGHFLRKTSLDELPQFLNVLRGEMSLVGPRPLPIEEVQQQDAWHNMRLEVTPGITCLWQIYARHSRSFDRWARLDIEYIRKRSPLLDLKLLLLTIPAVISMRGAQ
jgi:lipopolysaccharide/colanic/teichoic acid biosynthesis glycosyltransferase